VLPIAGEPLPGASITIDQDRIVSVDAEPVPAAVDLGRVAILPSLVNAHTHLELSHLRGAVPPAQRFTEWIKAVIGLRRGYPDPLDARIVSAATQAIAEARASGTGLVGDVANTAVTLPLLREARLPAHVFYELLGFNAPDPEARVAAARASLSGHDVRASVAPHAPYSVSPALFGAIRADLDRHPGQVSTVHLGESAEELEFLQRGTGAWRTLLEELGAWSPDWKAPGVSPVEYLEDLGFLDSRVLAVHGVQFSGEDLARLRALNVTVVSCPRSNRWVGVGSPPVEAFYAMDVDVAFGTDSLASVDNLNLFAELAEARRLAPRVAARSLLRSATLTGACALGFGDDFGSIETGKRASVIAVRVPEGVDDVEEYLVSGITPDRIQWVS
jgi:cytosine/adenosine deaminase-related metal-dependent hydrolase